MAHAPLSDELLQLRRDNTLTLFARWRYQEAAQGRPAADSAFAARLGVANAQWSRIKSGTAVGHKLARQIEEACGVPLGWLDEPKLPELALQPLTPEEATAMLKSLTGLELVVPAPADEEGVLWARVQGLALIAQGLEDGDLLLIDTAAHTPSQPSDTPWGPIRAVIKPRQGTQGQHPRPAPEGLG